MSPLGMNWTDLSTRVMNGGIRADGAPAASVECRGPFRGALASVVIRRGS
jgi:hypothetical protein